MGPMCLVQCRFAEPRPSLETVKEAVLRELGSALSVDSVEHVNRNREIVGATAQDLVALTYALKAMQTLGGTRVGRSAPQPLPAWVNTPWHEHSWFSRWRIRLRGPFAL